MGTLRIASGQKWNIFERGTLTVSSEHSQLGKGRLIDRRPERQYLAASAVADLTFTCDGNIIANGGLDSWPGGLPEFWTVSVTGAGSTVTAEPTIKVAGANAAKLTAGNVGGAEARISQVYEVRSGEARQLDLNLRSDGSALVQAFLQNLVTGKYLLGNGTWTGTPAAVSDEDGGGSYTNSAIPYTVESYAACGERDLVQLRLSFVNATQNTVAYVDEVYDWPAFNCAALIGPSNILPLQAVEFRSDTAAFAGAGTLEATFTNPLPLPSAYSLLGSLIYRRYSRIKITGTPLSAIELCEAAVCQVVQPTQHYAAPRLDDSRFNNLSVTTPGGSRHVHKLSKYKARRRVLPYWFADSTVAAAQAAHRNARELFFDRPEGELWPALVIPDTDLTDVLYARLLSSWAHTDEQNDYLRDVTVEVQEMPFAPTVS